MSLAILAQGTLLKFHTGTSSGSSTTIPEVKKISGPSIKFDILDVTSHDSPNFFREFIPGMIDGANCTADINLVPGNATQTLLRTDALARNLDSFDMAFPTSGGIAFTAYITDLMLKADAGQVLEQTCTFRPTGTQTYT